MTIAETIPLEPARKTNPCGGCTVCCNVLSIRQPDRPDLDKEMYTDCRYICSSGCAIYAERPELCRHWECAYAGANLVEEGDRPDNLGVMFYWRALDGWQEQPHWAAVEARPGALESVRAQQLLDWMIGEGQWGAFMFVKPYQQKGYFIGSPDALERVEGWYKSQQAVQPTQGQA